MAILTRAEAVAIKLMYPEKDVWNASEDLGMEPIMMETEK